MPVSAQQPKPNPPGKSANKTQGVTKKKALPPLSDTLTGLAKAEYEAGRLLYKDGDFANALVKYTRAYELGKDHRLLYNIAACQKSLRDYSRAQKTLAQFRIEGADKLTEAEIASIDELEKVLLTFISSVTLLVSEPDVTVFVDDENVGTSPFSAPISLNVGDRKFRFEKAGLKTLSFERTVEGGAAMTVSAKLEKEWHRGKLIVEVSPKDLIAIDGKVVGLGRFEGLLPSGGHILRVTAKDMTPFQSEVVLVDDQTRRVPVTLSPLPTPPDTAKWFWIGGGAVLAVGSIIGGIFMFTPTQAPAAQGTLGTFPLSFGGK